MAGKHIQFDSDYPMRDFLHQFEEKYDEFEVQYKGQRVNWYWWWLGNCSIDLEPLLEQRLANEV